MHQRHEAERRSRSARCLFAYVLLLSLALAACRTGRQGDERRYPLEGTVVSIDKAQGRLVIDHKEIPGFMGAMTMPYPTADPKDLDRISPGDQITADVVVGQNQIRLEKIVVVKKSEGKSGSPGAQLGPFEQEKSVPDFALVNQDGKHIHLGQYHGKTVLLTFIYTRCPLPDYCPLMTHNFAEIEKTIEKSPELYAKTQLLSISFDSKYDTPSVLRNYAKAFVADRETFQHWDFATIPAAENSAVTKFFDIFVTEDQGQITHSMSTAIISSDGHICKAYSGNDWKPDDVLADLKSCAAGDSSQNVSQSLPR